MKDFQPLLARGALKVENVGARPDKGDEAHNEFFADRVDRRVRHLCKVLLEVRVQQLRLRRQGGQRRVRAHGANAFLTGFRHGRHEKFEAFLRVTERLLQVEQRDVGLLCRSALSGQRQVGDLDLRALQPGVIRMAGRDLALEFLIRDDAALLKVDEQHLARLQPPFLDNRLFGHRQHARFGRHHHDVVLRHVIPCGPQPVSVECCTDLAAIGEGHSGRAVPRLHQAGMIFIEGTAPAIHERIAGPCLGDEHHCGMRQAVAAHD